jgi:hypothetical protein
MKRHPSMTDEQWNDAMKLRKEISERRMTEADLRNGFFSLDQLRRATAIWYGSVSDDLQVKAEARLHRGEIPEGFLK